jgi:hypothetical protein
LYFEHAAHPDSPLRFMAQWGRSRHRHPEQYQPDRITGAIKLRAKTRNWNAFAVYGQRKDTPAPNRKANAPLFLGNFGASMGFRSHPSGGSAQGRWFHRHFCSFLTVREQGLHNRPSRVTPRTARDTQPDRDRPLFGITAPARRLNAPAKHKQQPEHFDPAVTTAISTILKTPGRALPSVCTVETDANRPFFMQGLE